MYNASATYRWYWTTDFGAYVDQTIGSTPSTPPRSITSFSANPTTTIVAGQVSTLSWSVSGATSITINNGVGDVTSLTSKVVAPTATTQYTLTANELGRHQDGDGHRDGRFVDIALYSAGQHLALDGGAADYLNAGGAVELGLKFRSDVAGKITGIRFYKNAYNTGVHSGSLWNANGVLLATGVFTNETATGWQTLTFSAPVSITANTTYVARITPTRPQHPPASNCRRPA